MSWKKIRPIDYVEPERIEQFWKFVNKTDGCWLWTGTPWRLGYGVFSIKKDNRRKAYRRLAHRVAYFIQYGVDPRDKCVLHHCDTSACVRGDHLFLGTSADNNTDRHRKGRTVLPPRRRKLTEEQVIEIRKRYDSGTSCYRLSKEYRVSEDTIRQRIINYDHWISH